MLALWQASSKTEQADFASLAKIDTVTDSMDSGSLPSCRRYLELSLTLVGVGSRWRIH